jgi:hypothetical protein
LSQRITRPQQVEQQEQEESKSCHTTP